MSGQHVRDPQLQLITEQDTGQLETAQDQQPVAPSDETNAAVSEAFAASQHSLYSLSSDVNLRRTLARRDIDPDKDFNKPEYWHIVAGHALNRIDALRSRGCDDLRLRTFGLLAVAPSFVFAVHSLDQREFKRGSAGYLRSRQRASRYNTMISQLAIEYPEIQTEATARSLLNSANIAIESPAIRRTASDIIHRAIRGDKHELGFGQLLSAAGIDFREGNRNEDLKGADYVVNPDTVNPVQLDVKASTNTVRIRAGGGDGKYYVTERGAAIVYSQIDDREFGGRFFVPPQVAQQKAPAIAKLVQRISREAA